MDLAVLIDCINSLVITSFEISLISGGLIGYEMRTCICWLSIALGTAGVYGCLSFAEYSSSNLEIK